MVQKKPKITFELIKYLFERRIIGIPKHCYLYRVAIREALNGHLLRLKHQIKKVQKMAKEAINTSTNEKFEQRWTGGMLSHYDAILRVLKFYASLSERYWSSKHGKVILNTLNTNSRNRIIID